MRNGPVHGDINCHELLADGNIQGECKAESIEIGEHAHVRGTLNYATLSVKKAVCLSVMPKPPERLSVPLT